MKEREDKILTLKNEVTELENKVIGVQDQMTSVMKLNAEVGLASQHWEKSYLELKSEKDQSHCQLQEQLQAKLTAQEKLAVEVQKDLQNQLVVKSDEIQKLRLEISEAEKYRQEVLAFE